MNLIILFCFVPAVFSATNNLRTLKVEDFGKLNNETVKRFTWTTMAGVSVSVISYGAIIQSIKVPDKTGQVRDIVLGFDDLESYVKRNVAYFGATVGRCANRIGQASFTIDGQKYFVAKNDGQNSIHGGNVGFDKVNWQATIDGSRVTFSYFSKHLEEGYPGNLVTSVTYDVTDDGVLHVVYKATTDKKTVVNLTNHAYFNLAGHESGAKELYKHIVAINADKITQTDSDSIPTGKLLDVGGTPYDLRTARRLGDAMSGALFDDNFCVSTYGGTRQHGAFCLEPQNYPDAVHHKNFPNVILKPGDVYEHEVLYKFGVNKADRPTVISA